MAVWGEKVHALHALSICWRSAFSYQLRHGNRPSTLDAEGTAVPRSCPTKKEARTGRSTLQPAGMPALPFHAPGVGNGGVGENATLQHGPPCRGKVHRPVTGPQMRGTGGTLIRLGERHRDRGHPPICCLPAHNLQTSVLSDFCVAAAYSSSGAISRSMICEPSE